MGTQPPLPTLLPIPDVYEYSFLSGKLNILNKHCLKSIIYGQSFRRGDQSSLGAEGGSPSAAAPTALFPVNWRRHKGLALGRAATRKFPALNEGKPDCLLLQAGATWSPSPAHAPIESPGSSWLGPGVWGCFSSQCRVRNVLPSFSPSWCSVLVPACGDTGEEAKMLNSQS